jgi:hypothetical protein
MKKSPILSLGISLILLGSIMFAYGQESLSEEWVARYQGPGYSFDEAKAAAVDPSNGNLYVTGESNSDFTTLAYDHSGNLLWTAVYDGPNGGFDKANAIAVDPIAETIYVTGTSEGDYTTVAYDSAGNLFWAVRYNGPGNSTDVADAVAVDPGRGTIYVTGFSRDSKYDFATVAYDRSGNELWSARYNGPGDWHDEAQAIAVDLNSGNVYVTGYSWAMSSDYTTVAYSSTGNELWVVRHDGPNSDLDRAYAVAVDPSSGNIYVTGYSWGASCDYATVAYDGTGNVLWTAGYDGPAHSTDGATAVAVDPSSGNVLVTGYSRDTFNDYATVAYDDSGSLLWVARYDGSTGLHDAATSIAVDPGDGTVYVTGYSLGTTNDYATVAYSSSGSELWSARYDGPENGYDVANALAVDSSTGAVYVTGRSGGNGTGSDYATVKYGGELDPIDQILSLIAQVESYAESGILAPNKAAPLLFKLKGVLNKLKADKTNPACNQLNAFINQVKSYMKTGKLSDEEGNSLIKKAKDVISSLSE